MQGKCLQSGVIYQATVTREDDRVDTYIGLSEPPFKDRFRNHKSSFKTRNPKSATKLSKHIWNLEDQNIKFEVSWKIVSRAKPFDSVTNKCQLCAREKFFIIFMSPGVVDTGAHLGVGNMCV